jgi:hypothetical protein
MKVMLVDFKKGSVSQRQIRIRARFQLN